MKMAEHYSWETINFNKFAQHIHWNSLKSSNYNIIIIKEIFRHIKFKINQEKRKSMENISMKRISPLVHSALASQIKGKSFNKWIIA